jgi:hypothetical protein
MAQHFKKVNYESTPTHTAHRRSPAQGSGAAMQRCAVFSTLGSEKNGIGIILKGEIASGEGRNGNLFSERSPKASER